jgi:hypothetical protein
MIGHTTSSSSAAGTRCLTGAGGTGNLVYTGYYLSEGNNPWTIGFAINTRANGGAFQYLCGDGTFRIFVSAAGNDTLSLRGPLPNLDIPGAAGAFGWTHVTIVYQNQTLTAFVDGEAKTALGTAPLQVNGTVPFKVGGNLASQNSLGAGSLMEDFRFYRRALGENEIRTWARESAALPVFGKIMITEVVLDGTNALELTNFSSAPVNTGGWTAAWRAGTTDVVSSPLDVSVLPGESIVVRESGTLAGIAPGTRTFIRFASLPGGSEPVTAALRDATGEVVDEVRISAPSSIADAGTLGGAFRGVAPRQAATRSIERVWGLDSNSGRDWTAETAHSLGLESRSSGVRGTDSLPLSLVVLNELDDNPDFIEFYNPAGVAVELNKWFLLCSAQQGGPQVVIRPFPGSAAIAANSYLVIGDNFLTPAELPNNIPYVDLSAVGGGNIPFTGLEFSCALYDSLGRPVDVVRAKKEGSAVVHNAPRTPSLGHEFLGGLPRGTAGDRAMARDTSGTDTDNAADWRSTSSRTMGAPNVGRDGVAGRGEGLDVRLHETDLAGGLTLIVNAGTSESGSRWGFLYSIGRTTGTGPILGLDFDAVVNYFAIQGALSPLDQRGSTRIDVPAGTFPAGVQVDSVFLVLSPTGVLSAYTDLIQFDT